MRHKGPAAMSNGAAKNAMPAGAMLTLARVPILNQRSDLLGYELRFPESTEAGLDELILFGINAFTLGERCFLRTPPEALVVGLVEALPAEKTVFAICERWGTDRAVYEACKDLKSKGFQLAIVEPEGGPGAANLFPLANYIMVDLNQIRRSALEQIRQQLIDSKAILIAENVDTRQRLQEARNAGFQYFQGFYFCEPEMLQKAKLPGNKLLHAELLKQLRVQPLDLKKLAPLVKRDSALVYRLLKLVNSPMCAMRQEVTSVETAILVLGEDRFVKMAMMAVLGEMNAGQPSEVMHTALIRARFCELGASLCQQDPEEQYMMGLMSLLPVMLQLPMSEVVQGLGLHESIRQALLGDDLPERALLAWIEAHERNDVIRANAVASSHGLLIQRLEQFYVDALMWEAMAASVFR